MCSLIQLLLVVWWGAGPTAHREDQYLIVRHWEGRGPWPHLERGGKDTRQLYSGFHNWAQSDTLSREPHLILFLSLRELWCFTPQDLS